MAELENWFYLFNICLPTHEMKSHGEGSKFISQSVYLSIYVARFQEPLNGQWTDWPMRGQYEVMQPKKWRVYMVVLGGA